MRAIKAYLNHHCWIRLIGANSKHHPFLTLILTTGKEKTISMSKIIIKNKQIKQPKAKQPGRWRVMHGPARDYETLARITIFQPVQPSLLFFKSQ